MNQTPKVTFFDSIAPKWDGWEDLDHLAKKLDAGLEMLGLGRDETVLDVGCGTGNLTRALLGRLSPKGSVTAVDFSPAMVSAAQKKISDSRVTWHVADAMALPIADEAIDRVICFSVWPHFDDYSSVLQEFLRILRPAGMLHIWHLASRKVINDIHASAGVAVMNDMLAPISETRTLLDRCGFASITANEDNTSYLVSAVKPPMPR